MPVRSNLSMGRAPKRDRVYATQVAKDLRDLRTKYGLGIQRLAIALKVSLRTVQRWFEGATPPAEQQQKIRGMVEAITAYYKSGEHYNNLIKVVEDARRLSSSVWVPMYTVDSPNDPEWFRRLRSDFEKKEWDTVWSYGTQLEQSFVKGGEGQAPHVPLFDTVEASRKERALNWLATAAFAIGKYEEAEKRFKALMNSSDLLTRSLVYCNYGYLQLLQDNLESSQNLLVDAAALMQQTNELATYNLLCAFSIQQEEGKCSDTLKQLIKIEPKYGDMKTADWKRLYSDPDLRWFRRTETFGAMFPESL